MRRLWPLLPILLTACSGDLLAPGPLGGPMGRFGHSLSGELTSPSPVAVTTAVIAAVPSPTPTPRALVATPVPEATSSPRPVPTVVPYSPAPDPTGIVILTPAPATPTPDPTMPPRTGLGGVTLDRNTVIFLLYDDEAEDGDRIRVELNGVPVPGYTDVHLTNAGTYMTLTLPAGANRLRFTALDEGERSPCTFGLRLSPYVVVNGSPDQYSRYMLVGESDSLTVYAP